MRLTKDEKLCIYYMVESKLAVFDDEEGLTDREVKELKLLKSISTKLYKDISK